MLTGAAHLPPGPRTFSSLQALRLRRDPVGVLEAMARQYGNFFTLTIPGIGPVVVIAEPATARIVLSGDPATFRAGAATRRLLPFVDPHTVLGSDGDAHRRYRRRLMPLFRADRLAGSRDWIAAIAHAAVDTWPVGERFPLMPHLRAIAFRVIARLALGVTDEARVAELQRRLTHMLNGAGMETAWLALVPSGRGSRGAHRVYERRRGGVDEILRGEIARRRTQDDVARGDDALALLLGQEAGAPPLGDTEVADELRSLLIVGHETTASALAWALDLVLRHPPVLMRLVEEFGSGDTVFLDAVIDETLRIRPPVIDVVRLLDAPIELGGSLLPPGTIVAVSPYLLHHRSDLFADPEAFQPERFLRGRAAPFTWVPFGGGARRCLGAALAVWEMRITLRVILERLTLAPVRRRPERARLQGTMLVPGRGGEVVVTGRRRHVEIAPLGVEDRAWGDVDRGACAATAGAGSACPVSVPGDHQSG
jgi:cytochrome P450